MSASDLGRSSLVGAIERLLIDRGPLSVGELLAAVQEAGFDLGPDAEERLLDELYESYADIFIRLMDDRWAHLTTLVDNRVFTHRLTNAEIVHDVLTISPDLVPILAVEEHSDLLRLVDGVQLTVAFPRWVEDAPEDDRPADAFDESGSLLLPPGTLNGLSVDEGDLVSLTITDRGIHLTRIHEDDLQPHPDGVRQRWAEIAGEERPIELETAVLSICANVGEAFRVPHPPITELLDDVGVARHGDWVASAGFDFVGHWATVRASYIAERYRLGRDEAIAVAALSGLHGRLTALVDAVLGIR